MSTSASPQHETTRPIFAKTRMEAFSDGVFAVAITLLVVDIATRIPQLSTGIPEFEQDWWPEFWPKAVSYVYSFVVVAVYWVVHHNEMDLIKGTTREFNWLNLLFLLLIVLIPFSAALLGNNWFLNETIEPDRFVYMRIPIFTYSANLILAGISLQALWWYAKRQRNITWQENILSDHVNDLVIRRTFLRNWIVPVATVGVLLVGLWSVNLSQWLLILIPLSYAGWTLWAAHEIRAERNHGSRTARPAGVRERQPNQDQQKISAAPQSPSP